MNGVIDLQLWQMLASYIFILILLLIVRKRGISREKEILISAIRMTIQLVFTGYLLTYLFNNINPLYTSIILIVMEVFAIYNILNRSKTKISKSLKKIISISMLFGTLSSLIYLFLACCSQYLSLVQS